MKNNSFDIEIYLANLISIAHADKSLAESELKTIETIRKRIGAKKADFKKAEQLVQEESGFLKPTGSFGVKVQNLEDMFDVAMSDGEISDNENELILGFSKKINLKHDILDILRNEAKDRLNLQTKNCPNCHEPVRENARFCPNCGGSLTEAAKAGTAIHLEMEIPLSGYVIEFAESSGASFSEALNFAKTAPGFQSCIRHRKKWYLASWPTEDFSSTLNLAMTLSSIRSRKLYVDGQEKPWDEVYGFCWCVKRRLSAYQPLEYCFGVDEKRLNLWGCKNAQLDWQEWAEWFSYGTFRKSGILIKQTVWIFDKQRIRHELNNNLHKFRYCPYLRPRLIEAVLQSIPDEVLVSENGEWKFKKIYEEVPGAIKVKEEERVDGVVFTNEYFAFGVVPRSLQTAKKIMSNAIELAAIRDVSVNALLK